MGGSVPWALGQLLTDTELERMGTIAGQGLYHLLALLCYDDFNGQPIQGVPEGSTHYDLSATGNLTADLSPGFAVVYNAADVADPNGDPWGFDSYAPAVLEAVEAITLDAHHATLPRIDIVVVAPATVDDEDASRSFRDPTSQVVSSSSTPLRRRFSATVAVVKGTAASTPTQPTTPAGALLLWRADVPATSGAATWRDMRPALQIGSLFKGHPAPDYCNDFVLGPASTPNALKVTASSPTAMTVRIQTGGTGQIRGIGRYYPEQTSLTIAAAHATLDRIDLVSALEDGTITVTTGTPGASPSVPASPSHSLDLASVYVAATVTTIGSGDITDLRQRQPYSGALVQKGTLDYNRLSTPEVMLSFGAAVQAGDVVTIPMELLYPDGSTAYDGPVGATDCGFYVELLYVGDTASLPADFAAVAAAGFTDQNTLQPVEVSSATAELKVLFYHETVGNNYLNTFSAKGRHLFYVTAQTGQNLKIERKNTPNTTGKYLLVARPVTRPGQTTLKTFAFT